MEQGEGGRNGWARDLGMKGTEGVRGAALGPPVVMELEGVAAAAACPMTHQMSESFLFSGFCCLVYEYCCN